MIVRKTTAQESRRINELFAICFETPYSPCPIEDPEHDDCIHWAAFTDTGDMMSNFTIPSYCINFDGHPCRMAGIGGVATLPQYRRQGGIRACFEAALPELYDSGYEFSYLYPFSTRFYRQFGYECCVQKYGWQVELRQLAPPTVSGSFRLSEKTCPQTQAIQAIDRVWEQHFNMMVQHREEDYKWTLEADPAVKQEFTYVWYNEEQQPKAYTTFKAVWEGPQRNLHCSRFVFADREGFAGLMGLFRSLAADHAYVKFQTPVLPSAQYLLPEWSLGAVTWQLFANGGMVRVLNVRSVLEKARYLGSGQVTLEIQDPLIPQNTGNFTVVFADGQAVCVSRTNEAPDAALTIPAFSALITGTCDWETAKASFPGLTVHNDQAPLQNIFFRKPLMISDFF